MSEIHDMVGAYVLDALSDEEAATFRAHLATCEDCQAELSELARVVDVLPLAVEPVEPPTGLKNRILAEIGEGERDGSPLTLIEGGRPRHASAPRAGLSLWQGFAAAAAAVVIAAGGAWTLAKSSGGGGNSTSPVAMITGPKVPRGITAALLRPASGSAYLLVDGMSSAPSGKVYELWLVPGKGAPRAAGVFNARASAPAAMRLPISPNGYPDVAITVEPGPNGSSQPTSKPIMVGQI